MPHLFHPIGVLWLAALGMLASACVTIMPTPVAATSALAIEQPTLQEAPLTPTGVPVRPQKGFRAPDLTLLNLEGQEVSLSDFRGQLVLVNFWAAWCSPCRQELPAIQAQYESTDDLVVLGVNFQERADEVRPFVAEAGLTFPILLDETGRATLIHRVRGLPTSFLVDADGLIAAVHVGPMTARQLANYVAQARGE
ncbi:MAG: TlpA family protein disulfide reductase [Anaerolineae bacterium]|nr:MAG: TlpA family protein disulfide reductase [Anaerolineae bacterium]